MGWIGLDWGTRHGKDKVVHTYLSVAWTDASWAAGTAVERGDERAVGSAA